MCGLYLNETGGKVLQPKKRMLRASQTVAQAAHTLRDLEGTQICLAPTPFALVTALQGSNYNLTV